MTPSATTEGGELSPKPDDVEQKTSANGKEQRVASSAEQVSASNGKSKKAKSVQQGGKAAEGSKDGKLSGKEAKEAAKAAKIARRAQEKQAQQGQPAVDLAIRSKGEQTKNISTEGPTGASGPPSKTSRIRTSSIGGSGQKSKIQTAQSHAVPITAKPDRENKNVALLDHLYSHPRRTSIAGACKDVHPAVLALGLQMRNYLICGSSARCASMMLVFKRVIESYITPQNNSLSRHLNSEYLSSQIDYLVSCRPLSISMGNAIRWLKVEISNVDVSTPESKAKSDLCDAIDNFLREKITVADQVITTKANEKIRDGDVILTFAKSNIVQQTLVEAFRLGKKFRVIVVDSRPLFEGKNLARALANLGLEVQYSLIHGISHVIKDVTKVFLGAHAMMSTGLYSRAGTALVAMTANDAKVPVVVCCESVKLSERVPLDSFVLNEIAPSEELILQGKTSSPLSKWEDVPNLQLLNLMYDFTPATLVNMVVTEHGIIPPSSVPVIIRLNTST